MRWFLGLVSKCQKLIRWQLVPPWHWFRANPMHRDDRNITKNISQQGILMWGTACLIELVSGSSRKPFIRFARSGFLPGNLPPRSLQQGTRNRVRSQRRSLKEGGKKEVKQLGNASTSTQKNLKKPLGGIFGKSNSPIDRKSPLTFTNPVGCFTS